MYFSRPRPLSLTRFTRMPFFQIKNKQNNLHALLRSQERLSTYSSVRQGFCTN